MKRGHGAIVEGLADHAAGEATEEQREGPGAGTKGTHDGRCEEAAAFDDDPEPRKGPRAVTPYQGGHADLGHACEERNRRYGSDDEVVATERDRQGRKHRDARELSRTLDENSLPVAGM